MLEHTESSILKLPIFYSARTDVGVIRKENQDSFAIVEGEKFTLFSVADGMGGVHGGAEASATAIAALRYAFQGSTDQLTIKKLDHVLKCANEIIFSIGDGSSDLSGMGTTIVAVGITAKELLLAHVGDSRAYLVRDGSLIKLTTDHTLVQDLVAAGSLSAAQAAKHPISHVLTRSLGPCADVAVECAQLPNFLKPNDKLVICSDGLYGMLSSDEIVATVTSLNPEQATAHLINQANLHGGVDNITVIVVAVDEAAVNHAVVNNTAANANHTDVNQSTVNKATEEEEQCENKKSSPQEKKVTLNSNIISATSHRKSAKKTSAKSKVKRSSASSSSSLAPRASWFTYLLLLLFSSLVVFVFLRGWSLAQFIVPIE